MTSRANDVFYIEALTEEVAEGSALRKLLERVGVKSIERLASLLQSVSAQRRIFKQAANCDAHNRQIEGHARDLVHLISAETLHSTIQVGEEDN